MKIDKNKLDRQLVGIDKWFNNRCVGTFEWVTGVGKTYAAILAMKRVLKEQPDASFLVVVPTDPLRTTWRDKLKEHKITNAKVDTVHMLFDQEISCDMLVLDEVHMYLGEEAEKFPLIFRNVTTDRVLGLSATLKGKGLRTDLIAAYCPVVDTIDLKEALDNKYVSEYIVYNYGIPLSQEDHIKYSKINSKFYRYFGTFHHSFDRVKACLTESGAKQLARQIGWEYGAVIGHARKTMQAMRARKEFLYGVDSKLDVAEDIINTFNNKKIITFSQTTEPADLLAQRIERAESYHSNLTTRLFIDDEFVGEKCGKDQYKLFNNNDIYSWEELTAKYPDVKRLGKKKIREYILDRFKSGEITVLCSAQALDVGFDDEDIDMGIVLSATSKQRQNIQRTGRVIRAKKGKRAIIIQLYILDTQDEKWLNERQSDAVDAINIYSTSQIEI